MSGGGSAGKREVDLARDALAAVQLVCNSDMGNRVVRWREVYQNVCREQRIRETAQPGKVLPLA